MDSSKLVHFGAHFGTVLVQNSCFWQFCVNIWTIFWYPSYGCGTSLDLRFLFRMKFSKIAQKTKTHWQQRTCFLFNKKIPTSLLYREFRKYRFCFGKKNSKLAPTEISKKKGFLHKKKLKNHQKNVFWGDFYLSTVKHKSIKMDTKCQTMTKKRLFFRWQKTELCYTAKNLDSVFFNILFFGKTCFLLKI